MRGKRPVCPPSGESSRLACAVLVYWLAGKCVIKANRLAQSAHWLGVCAGLALAFDVCAQTNSWTSPGSVKWETTGNWSAGAPSSSNAANLITNATSKAITLDAATVASGTMTISNLVVSGPIGTTNTVKLTNTTAT